MSKSNQAQKVKNNNRENKIETAIYIRLILIQLLNLARNQVFLKLKYLISTTIITEY